MPLPGIEKIMKNQMTIGEVLPPEDMAPVVNPSFENESANPPGVTPGIPEVIPGAPTFTVPANPLLPEGYQEILDYNTVQYANGFYRTQIGRYVRIEQLMGSNFVDNKEGYLVGVGINYILLQAKATGNITVIDIYGIKSMLVYYEDMTKSYSET